MTLSTSAMPVPLPARMIILAPMEGLLDFTLRDILTRVGGVDRCVAEFIRVTGTLLPERVFTRVVPELKHGGVTPAGVPVRAQLMGSDAVCLAENAARLAGLGPAGIDLNFGCPAKVVNRHGGGAALLDDPELIARIVGAVRRAVPQAVPVSAKMRLGFNDDSRTMECAHAIVDSGASELVVHARTKLDGYRPPAYWERIARIKAAVNIPVIANGEIWTVADAMRCRELSGCDALMLGRGMVSDPWLALAIIAADRGGARGTRQSADQSANQSADHGADRGAERHADGDVSLDSSVGHDAESSLLAWTELQPLLAVFWQLVCDHIEPRGRAGRLKHWLNYLRRRFPQAEAAYAEVRTINDPQLVAERLGLVAHRLEAAASVDEYARGSKLLETVT
jgi:tRNA-dihydrouridine synthase C